VRQRQAADSAPSPEIPERPPARGRAFVGVRLGRERPWGSHHSKSILARTRATSCAGSRDRVGGARRTARDSAHPHAQGLERSRGARRRGGAGPGRAASLARRPRGESRATSPSPRNFSAPLGAFGSTTSGDFACPPLKIEICGDQLGGSECIPMPLELAQGDRFIPGARAHALGCLHSPTLSPRVGESSAPLSWSARPRKARVVEQ